jgi:hypothetical protein
VVQNTHGEKKVGAETKDKVGAFDGRCAFSKSRSIARETMWCGASAYLESARMQPMDHNYSRKKVKPFIIKCKRGSQLLIFVH